MTEPSMLPLFAPGVDPGASFVELLRQVSPAAVPPVVQATGTPFDIRRATAVVAIANRRIEKVYAADEHSGVAIAGAAGPAVEMVRLFQVQLRHYEKVEGEQLSLEGKANQLAQMVRANLPAAMQGFVVVPLFAGYDHRRRRGRVFSYDAT